MTILIIIFGILMLLAGILLLSNPDIIFKVLRENADKPWLHIAAVLVRLLLGSLLLFQASISKLPVTMEIIGWLAIFAAIVLMVIGRNNFKRLITWVFSLFKPFSTIGGMLALCFGTLLIYAFV